MQVAGHGQRWGKVSARAYRTGIRTTLKLARLLAVKQSSDAKTSTLVRREPIPAVRWLLEYARSRADILARDVHLYERERIQSILIQASIARTTANIDRDLNGHLIGHPSDISALQDAVQYVSSAERRLIDLGSPRPVARRWIVERLNVLGLWLRQTVTTWSLQRKASTSNLPAEARAGTQESVRILADEVNHLAISLVHDLNALEQLADNSPFWVSLHRRAALRYELLRNRVTLDGFDWPLPSQR